MASSVNYVPQRDGDFNSWLNNFSTYLTANYLALGVSSGDASNMASLTATWNDAYAAALAGSTRGPMTVSAKDAARANAQLIARQIAINVNNNAGVTDVQKTALGITVRKTTKTPVPIPTTVPLLSFVAATPNQHTLRMADQLTPASRALPFGAIAAELHVFVSTTPPVSGSIATMVLTETRNPIGVNFTTPDVGKNAYYRAAWRTRTGELGPFGTIISAGIIGS